MTMKIASALVFLFTSLPLVAQEAVKPTAEHQKLAATAGTWDAVMSMAGEGGKAMEFKGVSVAKIACGGLWLLEDFMLPDFMGAPYHGHGTTGYDAAKGKYVSTWVDSMTTSISSFEGNYDAAGKVLTMTGTSMGPDGKPAKHRLVTTWNSADQYVFAMFITGADGNEAAVMTITYTRRAAKVGDQKAPTK